MKNLVSQNLELANQNKYVTNSIAGTDRLQK